MARIDQLLAFDLAQQELQKEKNMSQYTKGECKCFIRDIDRFKKEIKYCPLHKAAPAMYEALKAFFDIKVTRIDFVESAKKALSKADGIDIIK